MLLANSTPEKSGANTPSVEGPPPGEPRLLDRLRARIRFKHDSIRTEQTYVDWVRRLVLFHGKRHSAQMGMAEVRAFLSYVAGAGKCRGILQAAGALGAADSVPCNRRRPTPAEVMQDRRRVTSRTQIARQQPDRRSLTTHTASVWICARSRLICCRTCSRS